MMKFIYVFLLCFLSQNTFCQHSQIKLSEDFKFSENEYRHQTIAHSVYHNDVFYTATNPGIGVNYKWIFTGLYDIRVPVAVSMFDKNMNKLKEVSLSNGEKVYGPLPPTLLLLNNKLCLAYFQTDNKSSFNFYLAHVDESTLAIMEPRKICTIEQKNVSILDVDLIYKSSFVSFATSPDKSKTLIVCRASPNSVQSFILDSSLNVLKQYTSTTPTDGFGISTAALTNDLAACIVLKSDEETKIICNDGSDRKTVIRINPVGDMYPLSTSLTIAHDGKSIYVCATTGIEKDLVNTNGLLIFQLDCGTLKLSRPMAYEFDQDFLETAYQKGGGDKHRKEFFMYNFSPHLIELESGNLAILGSPEKLSTEATTTFYDGNRPQTNRVYQTLEVGPVMAIFPNKGSKGFKYVFVPRRMESTRANNTGPGVFMRLHAAIVSNSYSNFAAKIIGDEIAIIYNDNEKNLSRGEDEKVSISDSPSDLVLAEAFINKDRKLQYRKQIAKNLSGRYSYFLGSSVPTSSSMIVFPIAKEGGSFNLQKIVYTNWCFLELQ